MKSGRKVKITPVLTAYFVLGIGFFAQAASLILSRGSFLENIVYDFSRFTDFFDHV